MNRAANDRPSSNPQIETDLDLPNYTQASEGPTLSSFQIAFFAVLSVGIYGIFLTAQNLWHRDFFIDQDLAPDPVSNLISSTSSTQTQIQAQAQDHAGKIDHGSRGSIFHIVMLALYGAKVITLSKSVSKLLEALVLNL
jgi:Ca2+/H+ antiporter